MLIMVRASIQIPESSAMVGIPRVLKAKRALMSAFSSKVSPVSGMSASSGYESRDVTSNPCGLNIFCTKNVEPTWV